MPGRTTISAPKNPTTTVHQRYRPTASPSNSGASAVTMKGRGYDEGARERNGGCGRQRHIAQGRAKDQGGDTKKRGAHQLQHRPRGGQEAEAALGREGDQHVGKMARIPGPRDLEHGIDAAEVLG